MTSLNEQLAIKEDLYHKQMRLEAEMVISFTIRLSVALGLHLKEKSLFNHMIQMSKTGQYFIFNFQNIEPVPSFKL